MSKVQERIVGKQFDLIYDGERKDNGPRFCMMEGGNLSASNDDDGYWYVLDDYTIYAKFGGDEYVIKMEKNGKKGTFVYPSKPEITIEMIK